MKWLSILAILPTALAFQQHVKPIIHQKTSALNFFPEQFSRAEECATHYDSCNIDELEDLANGKSNQPCTSNNVSRVLSLYWPLYVLMISFQLPTYTHSPKQNSRHSNPVNFKTEMITKIPSVYFICYARRRSSRTRWRNVSSELSLLNLIKYIKLNHNLLPLYRCHWSS